MRPLTDPASRLLRRSLSVGVVDSDDAQTRLRKSGLLLTAWSVMLLSIVWFLLYLALNRPLAAALPFGYELVTIASIAWIGQRGWNRHFETTQMLLILVLPVLLMWSLGGFASGSAVIIWSFVAPMGALVFATVRPAGIVFGGFLALVLISGIIDPWLVANVEAVPDTVIRAFFVLNIVAVGCVTFGGTVYFVHQRDQAQSRLAAALTALDSERVRSDDLLRNILPDAVAERLKNGEVVADRYEAVTVLFADIVGFTPLAADLTAEQVVGLLDGVYGGIDELAAEHGLVRIKTMGDAYMAAAGVPDAMPPAEGAKAAAAMSLAMVARIAADVPDVQVRIGLHTGPAVAGVIGRRTFAYDIWGDAVNIASRMESHGLPGHVQISSATHELIDPEFPSHHRGRIEIKGLGLMDTYLLLEEGRPQG